jgi:uncharacterized protein YyaL (SSP411 family)
MAMNLAAWYRGLTQIVIVGTEGAADTQALHRVVAGRYLPDALVLPIAPESPRAAALAGLLPWVAPLAMRGGAATAYVCRHFTCEQPVTTPDALAALLPE